MAATKIKRRYTDPRKPEFKLYSDTFDKCVLESNVLNRESIPSMGTIFWDKNNLRTHIELFETDHIPAREAALVAAHNAFQNYNEGRRREGRAVTEEYPTHLLSRKVKAEARLDVAKRELEFLQERLEKYYNQPEAELLEKACLEYGPRGNGRLKDGLLIEVDGQRVTPHKLEDNDEILVIAQSNSPYFGMSVADYRTHVVVPWTKERRMHQYNLEKQRQKEISESGFSKITIPNSGRKVHTSSIPTWPEGVKNHFDAHVEAVVDEDVEKLQ